MLSGTVPFKRQEKFIDNFRQVKWRKEILQRRQKPVFCWHKSFFRYRVNLPYRTAHNYLLIHLTQFIRCFRTLNKGCSNVEPITVLLLFTYSYMFGVQQTVNTTFQSNTTRQYISIEQIELLVCWITAVYSMLSFYCWQLQNCSVRPNEMCIGDVKVLGMFDKSVRCYIWNCTGAVDKYRIYIYDGCCCTYHRENMEISRLLGK